MLVTKENCLVREGRRRPMPHRKEGWLTAALLLAIGLGACTGGAHKASGASPGEPSKPDPRVEIPSSRQLDHGCPESVLGHFVARAYAGEVHELLPLLSADLRTRYDARTLRADRAEARDSLFSHLEAIDRALAEGGLVVSEDDSEAVLPLGSGLSVHMVRETGGWRVRSLH